jgi:hypothetical protein
VLAAALALTACKKDAPEASLPAATQVGANTAGCLIDGKPFIAAEYGGGLLSNPIPALQDGFYEDSLYYLTITGVTNAGKTQIYLFFRSQQQGTYSFDKVTPILDFAGLRYTLNYAACKFDNSNELYITNSSQIGNVSLLYANYKAGISAGTFEFTAASQIDPRKTVTITSGRFDRKQ